MKRLLKTLVLLLALTSLTSCGISGGGTTGLGKDPVEGVKMTAKVTEVTDRLGVEVLESEYAFGPYLVHMGEKVKICSKSGEIISLSDIKEGDTVEITYSGQVMMSYPPQIVALQIVVK